MGQAPPRLHRMLDFLGAHLHPVIEEATRCDIGYSRRACILSSLVARDVLERMGLEAVVAPTIFRLRRWERGAIAREFLTRDPSSSGSSDGWGAHMVIHAEGWLADFTLARAGRRWEWQNLPPMLAARIDREGDPLDGRYPRVLYLHDECETVQAEWFDSPDQVDWSEMPDARPWRRDRAVKELISEARKLGLI
jgi:hypothetical protein